MKTFTKWLQFINEVNQKILPKIDKANRRLHSGTAPFQNIFGTKKRISFDLNQKDKDISSFIQDLAKHNVHLTLKDLQKGNIDVPVQSQQGTSTRNLRIASYIQRNIKDSDELVKRWGVVRDKVSKMNFDDSYSVIISRAPLDIMRMSDHVDDDGYSISSCHSPDGEWFHCAIREAQLGGAVAYAVKTSDLNKVDLQASEIFKDKDRKIDGIVPLERIRLRRFSNDDVNILIPEIRNYPMSNDYGSGRHVPGFKEAVKDWAYTAQKSVIDNIDPQRDYDYFSLRGGSYQDNAASIIWNNFFGTKVVKAKSSIDQKDGDVKVTTAGEWRERAEEMLYRRVKYWDINFSANQKDGDVWGEWNAETEYEFDGWEFDKVPTEDNISDIGKYTWSATSLTKYLRLHFPDIGQARLGGVYNVSKASGRVEIKVYIDGNSKPDAGTLNDFEHFIDKMEDLDYNHETIKEHIEFWFRTNGFMKNPVLQTAKRYNYKHFRIENLADKKNPRFQRMRRQPHSPYEIESEVVFLDKIEGIPDNYIRKRGELDEIEFIGKVPHSLPPSRPLPKFVGLDNVRFYRYGNDIKMKFNFILGYDEDESRIKMYLAGIHVLDKNFEFYVEKMRQWLQGLKTYYQ
jgi:hypothetical protein